MKINNVDSTFNFSLLDLDDPKGVQGGSHVTKIKVDKEDFYIKTDRCISRNGIVTNGRKRYIDLMFSSADNTFVEWIENLEESLQKKIFEKSGEWFENELSRDDIENSFLASLKPFRSGKFYLLRCNLSPISQLSGSGVKVYDEDGKDLSPDDVKEGKKMVCIININEIRFSSKNFQIDYYVKQIMILNDVNINNEKLLLIGSNDEENNVVTKLPKNNTVEESVVEQEENMNDKQDDKSPIEKEETTNVLGETENQEKNDNEDDNSSNVLIDVSNIEFNDLVDVSNSKSEELNVESLEETATEKTDKESEENVVLTNEDQDRDINENDVLKDNLNDSKKLQLEERTSLENSELNLEDCEVNFDFSTTGKDQEITLKNPKDVYIEIYKAARKKAKETREKAAQAFLEANNIKKKYNLTEIFDSDEEDEEESYLSNF